MPADTTTQIPASLAEFAAIARSRILEHFPAASENDRNALKLAEEAGEALGAYNRLAGHSRRAGTFEDVGAELADVIITAYVLAESLGIDLDAAWKAKAARILTRGWREGTGAAEAAIRERGRIASA